MVRGQDPVGEPWQRLYFLPDPQGQGALREGPEPTTCPGEICLLATWAPGDPLTWRSRAYDIVKYYTAKLERAIKQERAIRRAARASG